jgi:hypothetical protein
MDRFKRGPRGLKIPDRENDPDCATFNLRLGLHFCDLLLDDWRSRKDRDWVLGFASGVMGAIVANQRCAQALADCSFLG